MKHVSFFGLVCAE